MWIRHRGMPRVESSFTCSDGHLAKLTLTQTPVLGGTDVWPIATEIALGYPDGSIQTLRAELNSQSAEIPLNAAARQGCPAWIFANNNDHAYGLFMLDAKSRDVVLPQLAYHASAAADLFRRTLLWGSLWDSVREVELDPNLYARAAITAAGTERDESLAASLLARTETAVHRYLPPADQSAVFEAGIVTAIDHMTSDPDHDLRIVWFRSLPGFSAGNSGAAVLKDLLRGTRTIPGVELRQQDRWSLVTALITYSDPEADAFFAAEQERDPSGDGLKFAWVAQAARPDAATKQRYFADYTRDPSAPTTPNTAKISEDWIQSSLGAFNFWNQSQLTAQYLEPALEALPEVKRDRKIFFLVAWLDAFMDGQQSPAALATVQHYLATADPDPDLRLKILEAMDELDRTVRIRAKFAQQ